MTGFLIVAFRPIESCKTFSCRVEGHGFSRAEKGV